MCGNTVVGQQHTKVWAERWCVCVYLCGRLSCRLELLSEGDLELGGEGTHTEGQQPLQQQRAATTSQPQRATHTVSTDTEEKGQGTSEDIRTYGKTQAKRQQRSSEEGREAHIYIPLNMHVSYKMYIYWRCLRVCVVVPCFVVVGVGAA